jgi:hypothetical protein
MPGAVWPHFGGTASDSKRRTGENAMSTEFNGKVYRKQGGDEMVVASGGKITVQSGGEIDQSGQALATGAGAGITGGAGTVYETSVEKVGGIITTRIIVDLTGLGSSTTDLDIIGQGAEAAHIGRITAAQNGTIFGVRMTCLELPAGGADDIDLYAAAEGTGVFDGGIGALTEAALITSGGAWASGTVKGSTDVPDDGEYLYLTGGEAGTAATYTAGKFLIELFGTAA